MASDLMMKCTLLLFAVALAQVAVAHQVEQLRLVCNNDKKVELTRASELAALVEASSSQPDEAVCSPRIQAAIVELDQLVNSDNDNVCSPAKINQIRAYYAKFVDKKSLTSQHETKLPKALKRFFLSYAFGVSRLCKTSMISSLMSDAQSLLNEQDFDQINRYTSDASPLSKMIKKPKDVDDLVLPRDIIGVLLGKKSKKESSSEVSSDGAHGKVYMAIQPAVAQHARRLQTVCDRRFRPIYEQLILPLISLSRLGLNFKADELANHLHEMKSNTDVHKWYRIVFLCEAVADVEILDEPQVDFGEDKKRVVRVLTRDEAQELMASQPQVEPENAPHQIDYQVVAEHKLDDLIVDKQDKSLRRLVDKFSAHKSELARIRSKVIRQVMVFLREFLKSGKVSVVGGLLRKGKVSNMNDELAKMADDYANRIPPNGVEQDDDEAALATPGAHKRVRRADGGAPFIISMVVCVIVGGLIFMVALG